MKLTRPRAYGAVHLVFLVAVSATLGLLAACLPGADTTQPSQQQCTTDAGGNNDCPVQGPIRQGQTVPMDTPGMDGDGPSFNMDGQEWTDETPTPTPPPTANPTNPSEGWGYPGTGGGGGGAPNPRPTCWDGSPKRAVTPYCPPEPTPSETP